MAFVVADICDAGHEVALTLSSEGGLSLTTLEWPQSIPSLARLGGQPLEILGVRAELATSALGGNRRMALVVEDSGDNTIAAFSATSVTAASSSSVTEFLLGATPGAAATELAQAGFFRVACQRRIVVPPGGNLSIMDLPLIDLGGDVLTAHVRARVVLRPQP